MAVELELQDGAVRPSNASGSVDADEGLRSSDHASKGCSLCEGPHHRLSVNWYFTLPGAEYVQLYLWLLKDFGWSQLAWNGLAMFFGTLSVLWCAALVAVSAGKRLGGESIVGFGVLLWLSANYAWMIGEMWALNVLYPSGDPDAQAFAEHGHTVARWLALSSVLIFVVFVAVLLPLDVFRNDRKHPIMRRLSRTSPPPRLRRFFHDFREYETLHLFCWALKDCLWVWNVPGLYMLVFVITLALNADLIWLLATHHHQYIDLVHSIVAFLWVLANGCWAYGEMYRENDLGFSVLAEYNFFKPLPAPEFAERKATGGIFFFTLLLVFTFYIQWSVSTLLQRVPSFHEFLEAQQAALDHEDQDTAKGHTCAHAGTEVQHTENRSADNSQAEALSLANV